MPAFVARLMGATGNGRPLNLSDPDKAWIDLDNASPLTASQGDAGVLAGIRQGEGSVRCLGEKCLGNERVRTCPMIV